MHCDCTLASVEYRITVDEGLRIGQLRAYKYAMPLRAPILQWDSGARVLGGLIFHNWFLPILYLFRPCLHRYLFRKQDR